MAMTILGTGSSFPENTVTNDDLSKIMDTSDEWIRERTGIVRRHISSGEDHSYMVSEAAKRAVEQAGIQPEELDLIIVATLSADYSVPSAACIVQDRLGAVNAVCFDVNAACSGFIYALNIANGYFSAGMAETALIIGGECLSRIMDWTDRSTSVLFGDGAGAAVVRKAEDKLYETSQGSDGSRGNALVYKREQINNPYIQVKEDEEENHLSMDGQMVYRFAVKIIPKCIEEVLEKAGLTVNDVDCFLLHQANRRIVESAAKRLHVPLDKIPMNLQEFGNTSAASIPILLDEVYRSKQLKKGDKIVLCGFGGGLTWGAILMEL